MKTLPALALVVLTLFTHTPARATALALVTVKQPAYMHTDGDAKIKFVDVQAAIVFGLPEGIFSAIGWAHRPATGGLTAKYAQQDINLASLYNITVRADGETQGQLTVTIDASKAKVPETYPFTIDQVVDAVSVCVKLMHPAQPENAVKFTVKTIPPVAGQ